MGNSSLGLWTVGRAAHLGGGGSHSSRRPSLRPTSVGPAVDGTSSQLWSLHSKGSRTNAAHSWGFTAPWPAGPLTCMEARSSMPPPIPAVSTAERGCVTNPGHSALRCTNPGLRALACQYVFASISEVILSTPVCIHTHKCACVCTHSHAHILPLCEASGLHSSQVSGLCCCGGPTSHIIERTTEGVFSCSRPTGLGLSLDFLDSRLSFSFSTYWPSCPPWPHLLLPTCLLRGPRSLEGPHSTGGD